MADTTTLSPCNGTMVEALEDWGMEEHSLLIVLWVIFGVVAAMALLTGMASCGECSASTCLAFQLSSALTFILALVLACLLPFPHWLVKALGVAALASTAVGLCLVLSASWRVLCTPEEEELTFAVVPSEQEGKEYQFDYVGCDVCGKNLSRDHFFSCVQCTAGMKGYELCAKCVPQHLQGHVVLQYKKGYCTGQVDLSLPVPARQDLQPLVNAS